MNTQWYDVLDLPYDGDASRFSLEDIEESYKAIVKMIEDIAVNHHNSDFSKIILAGFSQGACMSLLIGVTY